MRWSDTFFVAGIFLALVGLILLFSYGFGKSSHPKERHEFAVPVLYPVGGSLLLAIGILMIVWAINH